MPRTATSGVATQQAGAAVRAARREASLTQAQLGRRLGTSGAYIANVEAGRENLTIGQLANIAAALGTGLELSFPRPTREHAVVPDANRSRRPTSNTTRNVTARDPG
jgi:transcriptional regulator with XRE-family HTH domain